MITRSGARLGSLGAVLIGLGTAFACTVENNLPLGDLPAGAAGAGGSAGSGSPGSGGSVASGGSAGNDALLDVDCDYVTAVQSSCARAGCHNARSMTSGLDLTPTNADSLVAHLKDRPALHGDIDCSNGGVFVACVPETCPPPGAALLVDSANPEQSWILKKLNGLQAGCGEQMPLAPGDTGFDAARKACVEDLVHAIAAIGTGSPPIDTCFSPERPERALLDGERGCACQPGSYPDGLCVPVDDQGQRHELTFVCASGTWVTAEDGACERDFTAPACQVKGPNFTEVVDSGASVQSPYSVCNSCTCGEDGRLVDCGGAECAENECPSGTVRGDRCLQCGPTGGCGIRETGCLTPCDGNADCGGTTPNCNDDGFCDVGLCF